MANETITNDLIAEFARVRFYDVVFFIVSIQSICLIGLIVNVFILLVVRQYKALQTPCFILIAGECVCAILVAGGLLAASIERAALLAGFMNQNQTRISCFLVSTFLPAMGVQSSSLITACIAVDRLFSILYPMAYRRVGRRYPYLVASSCLAYGACASIGGTFSNPADLGVAMECTFYFSPFTPEYLAYYGGSNLTFGILCLVLYAAMLATFHWRKKKLDMNSQADRVFLKQQLACMPTVKLMMGIYALTAIFPEILIQVTSSTAVTIPFMPRIYYYGCWIKAAMTWTEMLALWWGSKQFKQCAKAILGMGAAVGQTGRQSSRAQQSGSARVIAVQ